MTVENLKSTSITNADASPIVANTRGSGAAAYSYTVDDTVTATASGLGSTSTTYRLCRIPANAKVKAVALAVSAALDSNATPLLAFDVNLAFSDSTTDGTPASLQGLIPTSANTGATTTVASYSSPNIIFGTTTGTQAKTTFVKAPVDILFAGVGSAYPITFPQTELWSLFGFSEAQGWFDLLLYVSAAGATAAPGTIYGRVSFVV
jgi:hypothetical protein